jgi:hypothetical protein
MFFGFSNLQNFSCNAPAWLHYVYIKILALSTEKKINLNKLGGHKNENDAMIYFVYEQIFNIIK